MHTLSTRATNIPAPLPDDPTKTAMKKAYYLACGFCRWTSRDVGMADKSVGACDKGLNNTFGQQIFRSLSFWVNFPSLPPSLCSEWWMAGARESLHSTSEFYPLRPVSISSSRSHVFPSHRASCWIHVFVSKWHARTDLARGKRNGNRWPGPTFLSISHHSPLHIISYFQVKLNFFYFSTLQTFGICFAECNRICFWSFLWKCRNMIDSMMCFVRYFFTDQQVDWVLPAAGAQRKAGERSEEACQKTTVHASGLLGTVLPPNCPLTSFICSPSPS